MNFKFIYHALKSKLTNQPNLYKLKLNGMKIGSNCQIQNYVTFDDSHCWHIEIGNNVTIAPRCYILAHDASTKRLTGYTKIGKVIIHDNVFIGANSTILPNVTIGENAIIGAGSVVSKNIPPNCVAVGSPAKMIMTVEEYLSKINTQLSESPIFSKHYTLLGDATLSERMNMNDVMIHNIGFIE